MGDDKKKKLDEGYIPLEKGYKPKKGTGGHRPDKPENKPTNPPKKR